MTTRLKLAIAVCAMTVFATTAPPLATATEEDNNRCYDERVGQVWQHNWGTTGACLTGKILDFYPNIGSKCTDHMVEGSAAHTTCPG